MNVDDFRSLLRNLQSNDSDLRERSEVLYSNMLREDVIQIINLHLTNISIVPMDTTIKMSIVLLGRIITSFGESILEIGGEKIRSVLQNSFFELFQRKDFSKHYLTLLAADVVKIAKIYSKKGLWNNFFDNLMNLCVSEHPHISAAAIGCLSQCINNDCIDIQELSGPVFKLIDDIFGTVSVDPDILIASLQVLYSCASVQDETYFSFINNIPAVLEKLPPDKLPIALSDLCTFAECPGNTLSNCVSNLTELLLSIIRNMDVSPNSRVISLQIMSYVVQKHSDLLIKIADKLVEALLFAACDYRVDEGIFPEDVSAVSVHEAAEDALEEISNVFGGNSDFSDLIFNGILQLASQNDVHSRAAAFMSLSRVFPNCMDFLAYGRETELNELFYNGFVDQNNLIRRSAFTSFVCVIGPLEPLYADFSGKDLIPTICEIISKDTDIDVLVREVEALRVFLSKSSNTIKDYLANLTQILLTLIQANVIDISVPAFQCVRELASNLGDEFNPYIRPFISFIVEVIMDNCQRYDRKLFFCCLTTAPFIRDEDTFSKLSDAILNFCMNVPPYALNDNELESISTAVVQLANITPEKTQMAFSGIFNLFFTNLTQGISVSEVPLTENISQSSDLVLKRNKTKNLVRCFSTSQINEVTISLETILELVKLFPHLFFGEDILGKIISAIKKLLTNDFTDDLTIKATECIEELVPLIDPQNEGQVNDMKEMFKSILNLLKRLPTPNLLSPPLMAWKSMIVYFGNHFPHMKEIPQLAIETAEVLINESRERHLINKQTSQAINDVREGFICEDDLEMKIVLLIQELFRQYCPVIEPFFLKNIAPLFPLNSDGIVPAGTFKIWLYYFLFKIPNPYDTGLLLLQFCVSFLSSQQHALASEALETIATILQSRAFSLDIVNPILETIVSVIPLICESSIFKSSIAYSLFVLINTFFHVIDTGPLIRALNVCLPVRPARNDRSILIGDTILMLLQSRHPDFVNPSNLHSVLLVSAILISESEYISNEKKALIADIIRQQTRSSELRDAAKHSLARLKPRQAQQIMTVLNLDLS